MSKGNKHSARRPWVREQSVCKFHKAKKTFDFIDSDVCSSFDTPGISVD